ncbi:hypothetical protein [Deinococcus hohokamensis]|uniref:Uncharacterized protein n=1 Tax=Deinococcus hohokamensis TaxID=309883 RepID=A0ABV9I6W1_9DEIO
MTRRDEHVSESETTKVTESHSGLGDTETRTHTEHREVHEEVPVQPAVEQTQTTTTTTTVVEN